MKRTFGMIVLLGMSLPLFGIELTFGVADRMIEARKAGWLEKAKALQPTLLHETLTPTGIVTIAEDPSGFQGWKITGRKPFQPAPDFVLDFGRHLTGYFRFTLKAGRRPLHFPLRLRLVFGETPAEVMGDPDAKPTGLSRAWYQDEVVTIDFVPGEIALPRRYAFRYVRCTIPEYKQADGLFAFDGFFADAVTSADERKLAPCPVRDPAEQRLDAIARHTLRDCMQTMFEDGPKRDRRLWLGDLRLQALANYETYRNRDLVKRCLYLLAGLSEKDNIVCTDAYDKPVPRAGVCRILDYTALFAPTVLEHLDASGDRETAEDLWPMALRQLQYTLAPVDEDGLFRKAAVWCFIDWDRDLDKQAAEQGSILYGLMRTIELANRLGHRDQTAAVEPLVEKMTAAARRELWDANRRLFVSGPGKQVSMASQIWMVLSGVVTGQEARDCLVNAAATPGVRKPLTPYLRNYWIEALDVAGLRDDARRELMAYWGGMADRGADTFWEGFDPGDDFFSPYGNPLINSCCHAWSCAPCYFLRRWAKTR
ncbi:MAG: hypothetical protein J6336_04715 [Kiritimatiellae bacterium]|nr:hypothetical protein [Kiritimatiellia bacterium]